MNISLDHNSSFQQVAPATADAIIAHALDTFGSEQKAWSWLDRPNPLFSGNSPIHILRTHPSQFELVEDELNRIDYGVFV